MKLTIVSGTNRPGNLSLKVARICHQLLHGAGYEVDVLDLAELPRDFAFDYLEASPSFEKFQNQVDQSSHLVFVVPEYNGSFPGILKLFIDACRYPDSFRGKHVAMIGIAAGGLGNEPGLRHLEEIMRFFGAEVFDPHLHFAHIRKKLLPDGKFCDQKPEAAICSQFAAWLGVEILPTTTN